MPLIIKHFFKKIITFYLILSLIFFSPFSFSALPAVAGGAKVVGGIIAGVLLTPTGKKVLKKVAKVLGGDDGEVDDDGNVIVYSNDGCKVPSNQSYVFHDVSGNANSMCKNMYSNNDDVEAKLVSVRKGGIAVMDFKNASEFNYVCLVDGESKGSLSIYCENAKQDKKTPDDVYKAIKKLADGGDEDAKKVKKDIDDEIEKRKKDKSDDDSDDKNKKKDDDDSDDKDKKKDKDDDSSDDKNCTSKKDDDDSDDKNCTSKKDDDDKKDKDDDENSKCSTSAFHKKVCDWIDWTYDETDKAKKKIADFFNDDEIDKINKEKLNHLVNEEDVKLKTYNFDIADACPTPKKVTSSLFGRTIEIEVFNFEGICRYAGLIEFALETTSTIIAINIIAGRKMD